MKAWTKPYMGVQHLETDNNLCTIVVWDSFTETTIYRKPIHISDGINNVFYGDNHTEQAKKYCESSINYA